MKRTFIESLNDEGITGVAFKNINLKKETLAYFVEKGNATIADIGKELNISVPKATTLINDLITENIVKDFGKVDSTGGRKPNIYGLVSDSAFFIGVDIKTTCVRIGISDVQNNLINITEAIPYHLQNTISSLDKLCDIIIDYINNLSIPKSKILGIGMNISGRVNNFTGYSYSFFNFHEEPLSKTLSEKLGAKVYLENDSRSMAYGEFCSDLVNEEKDVLFINMDHGIGLGILVNGSLYYGKSGYSGEFGHIPIFDNEIICHCGKKGCLETEASGWALKNMLIEKLKNGQSSIITQYKKDIDSITLEDILDAANNDDFLSIELIGKIGENLGRGIALLINIFNPEVVILGGSLAATKELIRLPIISSVNKYSLSLVNSDTKFIISNLGDKSGIIGACLIARNRTLGIFK
ncbi:ROK family protein [Pseudopedobacter beijingensis]|uniref:ROK family protein n=1 Tax=Pseudopedobacter beijingensis TaxID=1207056 RepID=A0ABW4IAM6_9SPHI